MTRIDRRSLLAGLAGAGTLLSAPALAAVPDPRSAFSPPSKLRCMIAHLGPEELDRITGHLRARGHTLRDCAFAGDLRSALIVMRQYRLRLVYIHRLRGRGRLAPV